MDQHKGSSESGADVGKSKTPGPFEEKEFCAWIDKYISCSADSQDGAVPVNVQFHKHRKYCQRREGKTRYCRFGFPKPPMPNTRILYPIEYDYSMLEKLKKEPLRVKSLEVPEPLKSQRIQESFAEESWRQDKIKELTEEMEARKKKGAKNLLSIKKWLRYFEKMNRKEKRDERDQYLKDFGDWKDDDPVSKKPNPTFPKFEKWLDDVGKKFPDLKGLTYDDYIEAWRSDLTKFTVFHKRDLNAIKLNQYNPALLISMDCNMDIQLVIDPYACVVYIVDYLLKAEQNLSLTMMEVAKECGRKGSDFRDTIKDVSRSFVKNIELSIQEACFLLLQLELKHSDRQVIFVAACKPGERRGMFKSRDELEEMKKINPDVGREELLMDNNINRYTRRYQGHSYMCLADFQTKGVVEFNKPQPAEKKRKWDLFKDNIDDELDAGDEQREAKEDGEKKADHVEEDEGEEGTAKVEEKEKKSKAAYPAEDGSFTWRRLDPRHYRVLRSPRFPANNVDTREKHFYEKLMLYVPYKDEEELTENFPDPEVGWKEIEAFAAEQELSENTSPENETAEDQHRRLSTLPPQLVFPAGLVTYPVSIMESFKYYDGLGDAYMEALQQVAKDRQAAVLRGEEDPVVAPGAQDQDEADRLDDEASDSENEEESSDDDGFGPSRDRDQAAKKVDPKNPLSGVTHHQLVEFDQKMAVTIRTLKRRQRAFCDHVSHWLKTRSNEALREFYSGPAGTGKSRLLEAMWMVANRYYGMAEVGLMQNRDDAIYVLTLAPTGKAAVNISGLTAHTGLKLPVKTAFTRLEQDSLFKLAATLEHLKLLIIDEISMLGSNSFFKIQNRLDQLFNGAPGRKCRNEYDFGGLHVLVFGDLYQLPPVRDGWIFNDTFGMGFNVWKGTGDKEHSKGRKVKEAREKKEVGFIQAFDEFKDFVK